MMSQLFNRLTGLDEVNDAAAGLAERFEKKVPKDAKANAAQTQRAIEDLVAEAKGLKRKFSWGLFKSSRLGNSVRWRLVDAGYPDELATSIAQRLAVEATYDAGKRKTTG